MGNEPGAKTEAEVFELILADADREYSKEVGRQTRRGSGTVHVQFSRSCGGTMRLNQSCLKVNPSS